MAAATGTVVRVAVITFLKADAINTATIPAIARTDAVGKTGVRVGLGAVAGAEAAVAETTTFDGGRAVALKSGGGGARRRLGTGAETLPVRVGGNRVVPPPQPSGSSTDSGYPAESWAKTKRRRTREEEEEGGVGSLRWRRGRETPGRRKSGAGANTRLWAPRSSVGSSSQAPPARTATTTATPPPRPGRSPGAHGGTKLDPLLPLGEAVVSAGVVPRRRKNLIWERKSLSGAAEAQRRDRYGLRPLQRLWTAWSREMAEPGGGRGVGNRRRWVRSWKGDRCFPSVGRSVASSCWWTFWSFLRK